jgi:cell division protein FtsW
MYSRKVDLILGSMVIVLIMLGQIMVFSASSMYANSAFGSLTYFFRKQLMWGLLGILFLVFASKIDYRKFKSDKTAMVLMIAALVLLLGLKFFGTTVKGATRWYNIGFMSFQPSELAKLAVVIYLAQKLSKMGIEKEDFKSFLMPVYIMIGSILILILIQPDLSSTLMICLVTLIMLFVSRVKQSYIVYTVLPFIPAGLLVIKSNSYQAERVKDWLNSISDPMLAAHQVKQSVIGIGRGGLAGNGMGESKQKLFFLPDSHTDFIFSIIGEEFGFIGTTIILLLFTIILIRGLRIAKHAPDGFGQFLALGITLNIIVYAFTNVAVVTNLFPATGLPMPFVSYGGSHLLFMSISVGILLNISRHVKPVNPDTDWEDFQSQRAKFNSTLIEVD